MKDFRDKKYSKETQLEISERVFDHLRSNGLAVKKEEDKTAIEVNTEKGKIFVCVHPTYDSQITYRSVPSGMRITFSSQEWKLKLRSWVGLSWNLKKETWFFPKEKLVLKTKEMMYKYDSFVGRREAKKESLDTNLEKMREIFPDYRISQDSEWTYRISNETVEVQLQIKLDSKKEEEFEFEIEKIWVKWDKRKPVDANQVNILINGTTNILEGYMDNWKGVLAKKGPGPKKSKKGSVKNLAIQLLRDETWVGKSYEEMAVKVREELGTKTTAKSIAWYYSKLKESEGLLPRK